MHTLLLLAGRSRRFWPLQEKTLWPFLGKPLLTHQLERLKEGGLSDVIFVGGHHNLEAVHALFPRIPAIEQEDLNLGMRGALLSALPQVKADAVCVVSSNDVIEPEAYRSLLEVSAQPDVDGAILAQRVRRYFPGGYLLTSPGEHAALLTAGEHTNPRVAGIIEKPGEGREPSDLVNIVAHVHKHPRRLLEVLEDVSSDRGDAYEVALGRLCQELRYIAVPYEGRWDAVKYPWHILDLTERFLTELSAISYQLSSGTDVHPTAVVGGPVVFGEGVRVMPHATVCGPCYIGKGSIVGTNALVRESNIGEQCVIGFGSEIVRSHLHSHVWTHSTYLGDSVVGHNVAFGAGVVVANFRLDEQEIASEVKGEKLPTQRRKLGVIIGNNVRIGIHAGFAPGVKIGEGSFINAGVNVTRDVEERRFVTVREGTLEMRENRTETPTAALRRQPGIPRAASLSLLSLFFLLSCAQVTTPPPSLPLPIPSGEEETPPLEEGAEAGKEEGEGAEDLTPEEGMAESPPVVPLEEAGGGTEGGGEVVEEGAVEGEEETSGEGGEEELLDVDLQEPEEEPEVPEAPEVQSTPSAVGSYVESSSEDVSLVLSAIGNGEPALLFFYASWCSYCQGTDDRLRELYAAQSFPLSAYRVDFDTAADLKSRYGILQQDTVVLIDGAGEPVEIVVGPTEGDLRSLLTRSF
jgi:bifunctional UDP-N-acetylglucosamine pyrophosphorylase/glucosamine-1-phosphate N-acetyltransferase